MTASSAPRWHLAASVGRGIGIAVLIGLSAAFSGWVIGRTVTGLAGNPMAPWILGRSAGVTAYLLLALLVATGLILAHPMRARLRLPSSTTRIRLHIGLAAFTLAFTVLHIVVLATDEYAKVGWAGTFIPMGSEYRPIPVTLGVIGLYSGLLAGLTAAFAGRWAARVWWPVHKVAIVSLLLVWTHGVTAGIDTPALLTLYLASGAVIVALAVSRYATRTPRDRVDELKSRHGVSAATMSQARAYR